MGYCGYQNLIVIGCGFSVREDDVHNGGREINGEYLRDDRVALQNCFCLGEINGRGGVGTVVD
jgi:hypothetical protein